MTSTIHIISHILYVFIHLLQQTTPSSTSESTQRTIFSHFTKKSAASAENPLLRADIAAPLCTELPGNQKILPCIHMLSSLLSWVVVYLLLVVTAKNTSRAHIVNQCKGIGVDVKRQLMMGTQAAKRRGKVFALSQSPTTTVADMRSNALASTKKRFNSRPIDSNYIDLSSPSASSISSVSASSPGPEAFGSERKHQPEGQPPIDAKRNFGPVMTQAEADKILIAEVKAIMHRGEPPVVFWTRMTRTMVSCSLGLSSMSRRDNL